MVHALIIDEDASLLELSRLILTRQGISTQTTRDPQRAVQLAEAELPDVIILNDRLPRVSGCDLCRQLKSHPGLSHIPIILLCAGLALPDGAGCAATADAVLRKPYQAEELVRTVSSLLT